jgi:hypothetical protein
MKRRAKELFRKRGCFTHCWLFYSKYKFECQNLYFKDDSCYSNFSKL